MPLKEKGRGGNSHAHIDLGSIFQAFSPDAGVAIETDPMTGQPIAKPKGSKWNQLVNEGRAQELANKFNLQLAADKYGTDLNKQVQLDLIDPRKNAEVFVNDKREEKKTLEDFRRETQAAKIRQEEEENKLARDLFGKRYSALTEEELLKLNEAGNVGLDQKISQARALKSEADLKETGNKALLPNAGRDAMALSDAKTSENLLVEETNKQLRKAYVENPQVVPGKLLKDSFLAVSPNETLFQLGDGTTITGARMLSHEAPAPPEPFINPATGEPLLLPNGRPMMIPSKRIVTTQQHFPATISNPKAIQQKAAALDKGTGIGDLPTVNPAIDTSRQSILPKPDPIRDPFDIMGSLPVFDRRPKIFDPVLSSEPPVLPATPPSIFPANGAPRITPTPVMSPYLERLLKLKQMQQGLLGNISGR